MEIFNGAGAFLLLCGVMAIIGLLAIAFQFSVPLGVLIVAFLVIVVKTVAQL